MAIVSQDACLVVPLVRDDRLLEMEPVMTDTNALTLGGETHGLSALVWD